MRKGKSEKELIKMMKHYTGQKFDFLLSKKSFFLSDTVVVVCLFVSYLVDSKTLKG